MSAAAPEIGDPMVIRPRLVNKPVPLHRRSRSAVYDAFRTLRDGTASGAERVKVYVTDTAPKAKNVLVRFWRWGVRKAKSAWGWFSGLFKSAGRFIKRAWFAVPGVARRIAGWAIRGVSLVLGSGLVVVLLVGTGILFVCWGLASAGEWWDREVHSRAKRMSHGGRWSGKTVVVETETTPEGVPEGATVETAVMTSEEASSESVPVMVQAIKVGDAEITHEALHNALISRNPDEIRATLPEDLPDVDAGDLWVEMGDHFREVDAKKASYYFGRDIAVRFYMDKPSEFQSKTQRKFVDEAMTHIGDLNRAGFTLVPPDVKRGLTDETRRLRTKYAMDKTPANA